MTARLWPSKRFRPRPSRSPKPFDRKSNKSGKAKRLWSSSYFQYSDPCYSFRELDHPNLCKFIGGCVEVPNVAIVTEYCPKGSLNDVLLNEEIPLNWGFRYTDRT